MSALLWKDLRVNRLVLIIGAVLLLGPLLVGAGIRLYCLRRYGVLSEPWCDFWAETGVFSLGLSMLSLALLGGNAIACERADRSAEFLACLPPSRRLVIASKAIVVIGIGLLIWGIGLGVTYGAAALAGDVQEAVARIRGEALPAIAHTAVLLVGAGWLVSSCLSSPAIASGIGIASPILLFALLSVLKYYYGYEDLDMRFWYGTLAVGLGVTGFAAGVVHYLRRVEP